MYSVYASQNGSITLNNCLTLPYNTILRVILCSKTLFSLTPLLITNIQKYNRSPSKKGSPKKPQKGYKKILRGDKSVELPIPFFMMYEPIKHTVSIDGDFIFDVKCNYLGPCFVRIIWLDLNDRKIYQMGNQLNFLIWNTLMFRIKDLTVQTILPNLVKNWDLKGYEAFHLCPIQKVSHSLYSIIDQLSIEYFQSYEELHNFIANSKKIFFIDVVLNHTSIESDWLDEEECVYNPNTVPQLASALELDLSLDQVKIYEDIEIIIKKLKLEEYFLMDLNRLNLKEFSFKPNNNNDSDSEDENIFEESNQEKQIKIIERHIYGFGESRYGVKLDILGLKSDNEIENITLKQAINALKLINEKQQRRANQYIEEAILNIQDHYKKYGCVQKYFHKLKNWYATYNGYVNNIDPEEDFVTSQNFHYLRHTIQKWNVIKLRYGNKLDTPLLLRRMRNYICLMAQHFHGIRLDNCHGTPLEVSQYLLKHARLQNPQLLVFAELFGCNEQQKIKYMSILGLNGLVDELCYCNNAQSFVYKLENLCYKQQISPPQKLVYDQTHDNQPPLIVTHGSNFLLSTISALAFSNQFKGTTKLVDEFYDQHISCVYEKRYYPEINYDKFIINKRLITFMYKYTFTKETILPKVVKMKGSFDGWQNEIYLYNTENNQKYYTCQLELDIGTYEYKFIVDDIWTINPSFPHNENNNIIEIQPIKSYKSLNFIRQIALQTQYPITYMESIHESIIMITKCQENHLNNLIIIICMNPIIRNIQLPSKINKILFNYSYCCKSNEFSSNIDEIPLQNHIIDVSTLYCEYNNNILHICTPTSFVVILECEPLQQIIELNQFLNQPYTNYDLGLLYSPLINHYEIPGCGKLLYSGLYGIMRIINKIETLDHPFIKHIKEGDWLINYLEEQHEILVPIFTKIKSLPTIYKWNYFLKCIIHIVTCIENHYTQYKEPFLKQIDILSNYFTLEDLTKGRETFMSFKGILILTGRFNEGKRIICKYGNYLQNGLIPNSLKPLRFNTRDTCFWWIKAIRDYCQYTEDYSFVEGLQEQIQLIFQSHATGIKFKETHITDFTEKEGVCIQLQLDSETGFIMGGNYKNCLTWMDKMGSGQLNSGYPAASRDGAPIECTALLKVCLDFVNKLHSIGKYQHPGIKIMNRLITWRAWSDFICQHFEKSYYVPQDVSQFNEYQVIDRYVRRKGIYKDIFRCSKQRSEYQLRPNSCIAIALAPELFQKNHVIHHLALIEQNLIMSNSLGLSTLDSIASEYSGKYTTYSDTFSLQEGFSLHNGSEFVFLTGYYLKALLKIHKQDIKKEIFYAYLAPIKQHLKEYYALPDFTNADGQISEYALNNSILGVALLKEAIQDLEEFSQKYQK